MATSADIPHRFDCVINGEGYLLLDSFQDDANAPQKAVYGYTPAFVPRTSTEGYGDSATDFFLTYSQKDWSLGERQKYQGRSDEALRRFWFGSSADVSRQGEVSVQPLVEDLTFAASPQSMTYRAAGGDTIVLTTTTNLYTIDDAGTITDIGVHGLGATPARWGVVCDGTNIFLTTQDAGTVGVRRWSGSAFSTFSATGSSVLEYLNNTLYGLGRAGGVLRRYSTAGAASTIHTFQNAEGTAMTLGTKSRLRAFGGKLLILLQQAGPNLPELWIYDGQGVFMLHRFSANFIPYGLEVLHGTAFISGHLKQNGPKYKQVIYYYANGSIGKLWEAEDYDDVLGGPALASFDEKLVFNDRQTQRIMAYNPAAGGVSSFGGYVPSASDDPIIAASDSFLVLTHGGISTSFQTPTLVQSNGRGQGSTSSASVSWPNPTTAGNLLLLTLTTNNSVGHNTPSGWTLVHSGIQDGLRTSLYKIEGASSHSGAQAVTFSGGSGEYAMQLFEYSGVGIQDKEASNNGTWNGTITAPTTGTTVATTQNDELWFAVVGHASLDSDSPFQTGPTNSFEEVREETDFTGSLTTIQVQQNVYAKNVTATGTADMGVTLSGSVSGARPWNGRIVTFKALAVGSGHFFPSGSTATGGGVTSPLLDFDSSLDKLFRGIKVDFDDAEDGDGGSIDISYRVNDVDGDYTDLQLDATSGTEYTLTDISGRSISVKITLNKGTSTLGPVVKRIYVRAVPTTNSYKRRRYTLNCTGRDHDSTILVRDKTSHTKDGLEMATDLETAAEATTPFTIADKLGSFTGIVEELELIEVRPEEFVARVLVREV